MKKIYFSIALLTLVLCSYTLDAQTQKIGHISLQALINAMPETDSAQVILEKTQKDFQANYQQMQTDYTKKSEEYNKNVKTYNELIKTTKESELQELNKRIQLFQASAQQKLNELNQKLLKPILDKANKAISDVAKEGKYAYILDNPPSNSSIIYTGADAKDIMPLVKKKLGLKE